MRTKEIVAGLKGSMEMVVEERDLARFTGNMGAEVLSTHRIILLMEQAARKAINGRLPDGTITVGTMIHMRHFAATPLGARVRAEAVLKEADGRRLLFDVTVHDQFEKISQGQNERFIVSTDRFLERVGRKTDILKSDRRA